MVKHLMALEHVAVVRYVYKSLQKIWAKNWVQTAGY